MFLPMSCTSPFTVAITILPCTRSLPAGLAQGLLLLGLHEGLEVGHRALHRPGALDDLRQEHLARSRTGHRRSSCRPSAGPSITSSGRSASWRASSVSASMKSTMPCTSACASRFSHRCLAPGQVRPPRLVPEPLTVSAKVTSRSVASGRRSKMTSSTQLQQVSRDVLVDHELAGVDDAHVEPGPDRVEQEGRVHRLAHDVVAAEGEGQVRDPAADP